MPSNDKEPGIPLHVAIVWLACIYCVVLIALPIFLATL